MLLDTLKALNLAGTEALETSCGLSVDGREISLVREGRQTFPSLITLRIKGCPLQVVHLGCDESLAAKLAEKGSGSAEGSGLDSFAGSFLSHLLEKFDDRNPRGSVEYLSEDPAPLQTRGVRTFQFGLETRQGRLFLLAEVPSRAELSLAKGSEFLTSMESIYLPANWGGSQKLPDQEAVKNFLTYLRKTEGDIYLETPAGDGTATLNSGLLIEMCQFNDRPALKLITDFLDPAQGIPAPGSAVKACMGIGDRSLEFTLTYQAPATHELAPGALVPCAIFSVPGMVIIGQRRQTFRVHLSGMVPVEIVPAAEGSEITTESQGGSDPEVIRGRLADLSFSGARIIAEHPQLCSGLDKDRWVECHLFFPDMDQPLKVMGIVRRSLVGPADKDQWRDDLGIEFLVPVGGDRACLDFIRQFVLEVQRNQLAQRLQVANV